MRIPKRLEENPLLDVIAEIRFSSQIPRDAILGIVYGAIKDSSFGAPMTLPIVQIPAPILEKDENLRYAACYRFEGNGQYLLLSPRSVALGTPKPYRDWDSVSPVLTDLLAKLERVQLFDKVERTGLRYINFFEGLNILHHTTLSLEIARQSLADQNITVRAEHKEGGFIVVLQLVNTATTVLEGAPKNGSVFDIDIICDSIDAKPGAISKQLYDVLTESNAIADKTFFNLLKPEFIEKFKPVY